jgi:hypothetical protein
VAEALRWGVCLIVGVPSALLILLNWLSVAGGALEAVKTGQSRNVSFCPPFLCGVAGSAACIACPWPGMWQWAFLPLLLDPSIALLLIASVLHVAARIGGFQSPFDRDEPPGPSGSRHLD